MAYSGRMQKSHLYSMFFAPRGNARMADLGMQIAAQYLSPFDQLIGLIGDAGSGKSMIIKGMFPGLELTNDDEGVNVRPLPLLNVDETGFYTPHTYHVDVRFESGFMQIHQIADAIQNAINAGKRVVVEHFDLIYPLMQHNANLLIGIGEEIIITRPTLFGPKPKDISDIVFKSIKYRLMVHSAEDICEYLLDKQDIKYHMYEHSDVRRGFILSFNERPDVDLEKLEQQINDIIHDEIPISFYDESHIKIGDHIHKCTGPRMHVRNTGTIKKVTFIKDFLIEPITNKYLMVGVIGNVDPNKIDELNPIAFQI